nr:DUF4142 domain-containing protein [Bradyrhizobium sp. CCGE-LA001]
MLLGMRAPSGPNAKQIAEHDKMSKMSSAGFDKMFATHMLADHQKDIAEYKKASKVRMLLESMLPGRSTRRKRIWAPQDR